MATKTKSKKAGKYVLVSVKVNAKRSEVRQSQDRLEAWVKALPIKNKANEELVRLVADFYGISPSCVVIAGGFKASLKRLRIFE